MFVAAGYEDLDPTTRRSTTPRSISRLPYGNDFPRSRNSFGTATTMSCPVCRFASIPKAFTKCNPELAWRLTRVSLHTPDVDAHNDARRSGQEMI